MPITFVHRSWSSLLTGLLLLAAIAAAGREVNPAWYERSWESADGLPDNNVCGVAQTPDGFLWVATAGGLMRFDGVRFQHFPLADLSGVPNRVVRSMLLDRQGRLWLDMDRGPVVCLSPGSTQVFTNNNLPDVRPVYMAEDARGAVWITYVNGKLVRIQENRVQVFGAEDGWPATGISSVASDVKGRLWWMKDHHVGVFEKGKFRTLLTLPEYVSCIGQRREGGIWICTGQQLLSFNGSGETHQFAELPTERNAIKGTALLEDRAGAVWIGTAANGLLRCAGTNVTQVPTSYRDIACLAQDREGNIWVGTAGGGLDRLRPRIIDLLGRASGLPYESVRSGCQDVAGAIWVVAQSGVRGELMRWQNGSWDSFPDGTKVPTGNWSCVAADPQGGLWIGTHDRGLYYLKNGHYHHWDQQSGLVSDAVRCILPTSTGGLYVAMDRPNQLERFRDGRWRKLGMPVKTHILRALVEDAAGVVWAASADGHLLRVKGDQVLDETPGVTNRLLSIRCLYATPDGSLWIGYAGWGIGWLRDGHYARITSAQGLYDDYVSQLISDNRGWLWCAGNRGIFEVPLDQLLEVAQGKRSQARCIGYNRGEGFPNLQANYDNSPGAFRSRDGRIWFPMHTGLAIVYPDRVPTRMPPPPVLLERVTMDGKTVGQYGRYAPFDRLGGASEANLQAGGLVLQLPPGLRKLDFEFTALSFTAPRNVDFQYRIAGLDDHWNNNGTARNVSYTRLPPGNYRFQVRACNLAGVWNRQSTSLSLVVFPFFWETWWFRLTVMVLFTLGVAAIVRYFSFRRLRWRLRLVEQQAALDKERTRIARDLHDDLGGSLTETALLLEMGLDQSTPPDGMKERMRECSTLVRTVVKSIDEIIWAINPHNDTLRYLVDYISQFTVEFLHAARLRCQVDLPRELPEVAVSPEVRHNLYLAVKEALNNIVRHAQASEVRLRVVVADGTMSLVLEDNGQGFDRAPDDGFADGLRNMRQRLEEIGGSFGVESTPGSGTRVRFDYSWRHKQ